LDVEDEDEDEDELPKVDEDDDEPNPDDVALVLAELVEDGKAATTVGLMTLGAPVLPVVDLLAVSGLLIP
jgi:hypothetical protein